MTVHADRSVRLPETEFFAEPQRKTGIALHHTVGGAARTTVAHWRTDRAAGGGRKCIATAYVIERDPRYRACASGPTDVPPSRSNAA